MLEIVYPAYPSRCDFAKNAGTVWYFVLRMRRWDQSAFGWSQVVKGIDAVTREELAKVVLSLGLQRFDPLINSLLLPAFRRPLSVVPIVTREDEVVLNNMRRIVAFLSKGSPAARSVSAQVCGWVGVGSSVEPTSSCANLHWEFKLRAGLTCSDHVVTLRCTETSFGGLECYIDVW